MRHRHTLVLSCLCLALPGVAAVAATLSWDPNGSLPVDGGTGTWTGNVWYNGSSYVPGATVAPYDDYVVSAGSGTITRSSNVNLNSLRVSASGYTIGGGGWLIFNSAGPFTLDPGLTLTLNNRMYYGSGTLSLVVGAGSTLTYDTSQLLGMTTQGATLSGGGTLTMKNGGFRPSGSVGASKISGSGTTLLAEMDHPVQNSSGYVSVESQGTYDLNNRLQGDISGATWSGLLGLTVTGSGSRFLGGGTASRLVVVGRSGGTSPDMGKLSVLSSGTLDTEGGWVGVFSTNADDSDLVVSGGGSISLGAGRMVLGYINTGTGSDTRVISLALSGGGSISGTGASVIDLTQNNTAAKTRVLTVTDDTVGTDFTIAAGIADGNQVGSGITKAGSGTLLLSGTNTYTGLTTVTAGTLKLSGSLATSKIVVTSTLTGGSGTIVFTPGDVIDVNGTMDLAGMFFDLSGLSVPFGTPVTLLDYSGTGSISNFGSLTASPLWAITNDTELRRLVGVYAPEPTSLMLLAAGAALLRRRRCRT